MDPRERRCEFRLSRDNKTLFNVYQEIDKSMLKNAANQKTDVQGNSTCECQFNM